MSRFLPLRFLHQKQPIHIWWFLFCVSLANWENTSRSNCNHSSSHLLFSSLFFLFEDILLILVCSPEMVGSLTIPTLWLLSCEHRDAKINLGVSSLNPQVMLFRKVYKVACIQLTNCLTSIQMYSWKFESNALVLSCRRCEKHGDKSRSSCLCK